MTKRVFEKTNYILDTLSSEYTPNAFNDTSVSFAVCVQQVWAIQHDDDSDQYA